MPNITKYFEIIEKTELTVSATPKLATFLHTTHTCIPPPHGGTHKIFCSTNRNTAPKGIRGSQKTPEGRPLKRKANNSELPDNLWKNVESRSTQRKES